MGVIVLVFAIELQKVSIKCISSDFPKRTGTSLKWHVCGRGRKHYKIRFYRISIAISQLRRNVIKMALK